MSCQRLRSGTNKNIRNSCPRCEGTGLIRSVESLSRTITHLLEEQASQGRAKSFQVRVPVSVATHLANERREHILSIETIMAATGRTPLLRNVDSTIWFDHIKNEGSQHGYPSYKLLKGEKHLLSAQQHSSIIKEQPGIEQSLKSKEDKPELRVVYLDLLNAFGSDAPTKTESAETKYRKPKTKC